MGTKNESVKNTIVDVHNEAEDAKFAQEIYVTSTKMLDMLSSGKTVKGSMKMLPGKNILFHGYGLEGEKEAAKLETLCTISDGDGSFTIKTSKHTAQVWITIKNVDTKDWTRTAMLSFVSKLFQNAKFNYMRYLETLIFNKK